MMIGWEPDGCGWEGRSRGRVQQLRRPCHPKVRRLVLMVFRVFAPADSQCAWGGVNIEGTVNEIANGLLVLNCFGFTTFFLLIFSTPLIILPRDGTMIHWEM